MGRAVAEVAGSVCSEAPLWKLNTGGVLNAKLAEVVALDDAKLVDALVVVVGFESEFWNEKLGNVTLKETEVDCVGSITFFSVGCPKIKPFDVVLSEVSVRGSLLCFRKIDFSGASGLDAWKAKMIKARVERFVRLQNSF